MKTYLISVRRIADGPILGWVRQTQISGFDFWRALTVCGKIKHCKTRAEACEWVKENGEGR